MITPVVSAEHTLVYDGDCGFCEASAGWLAKRAPQLEVKSHYQAGLGPLESVMFTDGDQVLGGAPAISRALRDCDSVVLRLCGRFIALPGICALSSVVYSLVAQNRARISRMLGLNACGIPPKG